jgi:CheY-like chemotaxis protein
MAADQKDAPCRVRPEALRSVPSSANVLIVEDDASFRDTLGDVLMDEGHSVHLAGHGAEALRILADVPTAVLIFLDVNMPVMDGITFLSRISEWPDSDRLEIVIMSAAVDLELFRGSRGVIKAIRKPFALGEIVELARHFSARHSPARGSLAGAAEQPSAFVSTAIAPPSEPEE